MDSEDLPCDDCGLIGEDCECGACEECYETGPEMEEVNGVLLCSNCLEGEGSSKEV